jgi:hypothetical protein
MASMQIRSFEFELKGRPDERWNAFGGLPALLAVLALLASSVASHALTPLRDPKDTAWLDEAKAACAAPNFPRFLRAFASSQIVRNAYTAEEWRLAETRIGPNGRRRTTTRTMPRLSSHQFPLSFDEGRYLLAPEPGAQRPPSLFDEARLQFLSPRRIIGETVVRWSVERGRMASQGQENARYHGYRGDFVFVGDGGCWKLIRIRGIFEP